MEQQALSVDRDGDAPRFLFVGGDITIDFINTEMMEDGEVVDRVSTPEELAAWVMASGLGREFGVPAEIEPAVHAQAIRVRAALKASYSALIDQRPVPERALETLNLVLGSAPGTELRRPPVDTLRYGPRVDLQRDARHLPWVLADAGAQLLCSDKVRHLRRCANHDTCVLVFLDTSRSHTRRWCSMDLCGNRRKVAAHNARARQRRTEESP